MGTNVGISGAVCVALVADEEHWSVFVAVVVDLWDPVVLQVVDGCAFGQVVHHEDALGPLVVRRSDRPETLLTRSVPDLEFDGQSILLDHFKPGSMGAYLKSTPMVVR